MWIYLLKFSACLAILLLFYKLVLEKIHIHHFKRYYLLISFIISLGIPLITFTQYVNVTVEPVLFAQNPTYNGIYTEALPQDGSNILPLLLWSLYMLGVILFGLKFLANLKSLVKSIKNNPRQKSGRIQHVLLQELIAPHTFFSYIFFNRKDYESQKISQEVFWHEETHANQKHSLDILLLELIQIVLWFHPLIYWAKHMVKLNHEFLADQAVLNKGASIPNYQNLILAFSSNAETPQLANAIHYSSIKKRIVIMKTKTSKKAIVLKGLVLIPLIALLLYSFSTKEILEIQKTEKATVVEHYPQGVIEQEKIYDPRNQNIPTQEISIAINKKGQLLVNTDLVSLEELKSHLLKYNQGLTKEQRSQSVRAIISVEEETQNNIIKKVDAILMDYGVATIDIQGPTKSSDQLGATKTEIREFNTLAKKYNTQPQAMRVVPLKDLKTLETIYGRMSDEQKQQALPFPECAPPPPPSPAPPTKHVKEDNSPSPNLKSSDNQKIDATNKPSVYYGKLYTVPLPPPEKNPDPVKYIKELAEKGATFYIGPHQYKTDEAIELVKKSKDPNIDVSDYPIVRLGGC